MDDMRAHSLDVWSNSQYYFSMSKDKYRQFDNLDNTNQREEDGDGGESGKGGFVGSTTPQSDWIRSIYGQKKVRDHEELNKALAEEALFDIRINVKAMGVEVRALTKLQEKLDKMRNEIPNKNQNNLESGGGANFEQHPELEILDGIPPDDIILPESETDLTNSNNKNDLKLRNRMAKKYGMSMNISQSAQREEYKKKMQNRVKNVIDKPRFKPQGSPRFTPSGG